MISHHPSATLRIVIHYSCRNRLPRHSGSWSSEQFCLPAVLSTAPCRHSCSQPRPKSPRHRSHRYSGPTFSALRRVQQVLPGSIHCGRSTATVHGPQQQKHYYYIFCAAAVLIAIGIAGLDAGPVAFVASSPSPDVPAVEDDAMVGDIPPGRPGNLTPEQEEKLRQLWAALFQLCGVSEGDNIVQSPLSVVGDTGQDVAAQPPPTEKGRRKRMSLFRRSPVKTSSSPAEDSHADGALESTEDDKHGQTKLYLEALANNSPEAVRKAVWEMVKHDHPDALLLRFLRARKWDVQRALVMLVSAVMWRTTEMHVDDDIMRLGEGGAVESETSGADESVRRASREFMAQLQLGKSFLHGVDRNGRPICMVRARLHRQSDQAEETMERYTVFIIETARLLLKSPVDTATVVFDMTDFSMANMDYAPVKFMIKCFEANYPECLGAVVVYKSPWIVHGIWKIIRGWLDPVVASKVHFASGVKDLEEFIAPQRIPKELDGSEDWDFRYVGPVAGENALMADVAARDRLLAGQEQLVREFESSTLQWIRGCSGGGATVGGDVAVTGLAARRDEVASRLRDHYWKLDPYVRARSLYDRLRVIQPGGRIDFYPAAQAEEAKRQGDLSSPPVAGAAPKAGADTIMDDLD